ncbi:hypothetical protein PPL_05858 [Heterostelium album PN500]|uniref:Uncharacterized protein n=1 Tax=Heterostelium pallidum (strain ATCC 26659 / Pp 5 / PN500) TaxID=670386 RepID=D3BBJ0_HETP5|nr:hypothetical protein PPL_05858 [Heterostelium album PN500]EFA81023.1 hypothetical protein PPL_05858 [Heterostelium album PN500]|eukprot:XP_020433141.1 hypothetical protein PPL_05858 [Heterostelium album PN500]
MPFPLTARKSLRDNEEFLTKAEEEIKTALGVEWKIEFDWDVLFDLLDANTQKQIGDVFYKSLCPQISKCVTTAAKDEIVKEALINANSAAKVVVAVNQDKKNSTYWKYEFSGGALQLLFRASIANINDAGYAKLYTITPTEGTYTLGTRLNLIKNQEKIQAAFEKLSAVTKRDFCFDDASMEQVYPAFDTVSQKESFGDTFAQILEYAVSNIEKRCKDDITLEAFLENTQSGIIGFRLAPKQSTYWLWSFENNQMIISFKQLANINDNSYFDFTKVLKVEGVFSLVSRLDLQKYKEKFDQAFERINAATKQNWVYDEASLEQVYPSFDEGNRNRIGETFADILSNIATNIERRCKDELILEAFVEATPNATIIFRLAPKQSSTWLWEFSNGSLIINFKSLSNISDNNYHDFVKVLPVPGVYSLVTRLDLKKYQEKFDACFERLKVVTKMDWSYDQAALEQVYPSLDEGNKSRLGETFSEIISNIVSNIEKRCKEEMTLEAFIESTANARIVFRIAPKQSANWIWEFSNGDLVVSFRQICNINDNSYLDFIKVLSSPGVLSLASRLNMKEYQERMNESIEKIKTCLGTDWGVESSSFDDIYPFLESESDKTRIGETFNDVLKAISTNIVKKCADEMVKEAFIENTANGKIIFRCDKKQTGYWVWKFEEGKQSAILKQLNQMGNIIEEFNEDKFDTKRKINKLILLGFCGDRPKCRCGIHMKPRQNGRNGSSFYSCANFTSGVDTSVINFHVSSQSHRIVQKSKQAEVQTDK